MPLRRTLLVGLVAPVLYLATVGLGLVEAAHAHAPRAVCFPAELWDAKDGRRPCAVFRLYEDGTFRQRAELARDVRASYRSPAAICFPTAHWAPAPLSERPCILVRVYEDGSYRAIVREADGDRWEDR